jgi:RNA polymerase sigma-70 factor (ECF subfamily)
MPAHDPSTATADHRVEAFEAHLVEAFEAHRTHLRAVAHRMLGSLAEADDAVQETWLRFVRAEVGRIENLGGWLTRVTARVCLDVLRARRSRSEREVAAAAPDAGVDPQHEAELADEVESALLVVLARLGPVERVAFVLHDLFAVPFAEIAPIVERSEATTKRMASRARQRVRGGVVAPGGPSLAEQRRLVEAFLAATRRGDLAGLLTLLAPGVVRRADLTVVAPGIPTELRGARAVAEETAGNAARAGFARAALVDGTVGIVVAPAGHLVLALRLTFDTFDTFDAPGSAGPAIARVEAIADPAHLAALHITLLPDDLPAAGGGPRGAGRGGART